jgi:adenylate kinase family enzyme
VAIVLVTGMSGTGKSTALSELAQRGYGVVDTDEGGWSETVEGPDGPEQLWREGRMVELLAHDVSDTLYVSGCVANQGRFYDRFDAVVLLSAPVEVVLRRIAARSTNDFGKGEGERERILRDVEAVEPLLRVGCTHEIDTTKPLGEVVAALEEIGAAAGA